MLNVSEIARKDSRFPLKGKIKSLFYPDTYLADNVADLEENAPKIRQNWTKRLHPIHGNTKALVILDGVNIGPTRKNSALYKLYDCTGRSLFYYYPCQEILEGLKEELTSEFVYDMVVRYRDNFDIPYLVSFQKYPSREELEKIPFSDRIACLLDP
jgi:hypothetical protein